MARKKKVVEPKAEELESVIDFDASVTPDYIQVIEDLMETLNEVDVAIAEAQALEETSPVEEAIPEVEEFVYDETYFIDAYKKTNGYAYGHHEPWTSFFGTIALRLKTLFHPSNVLDVGCATGILVSAFHRKTGIKAIGIDASEWAIDNAPDKIKKFLTLHDVRKPFPKRGFDLVTCIEVLEHVSEDGAADAIRNICAAVNDGGYVVFSSSPSDVESESHVNVRNEEYWLRLFADNGFTKSEHNVGFISPHAIVLRK